MLGVFLLAFLGKEVPQKRCLHRGHWIPPSKAACQGWVPMKPSLLKAQKGEMEGFL